MRGDTRERLAIDAERVRKAQLGALHAKDLVAELPTDDDDEQTRRHRTNLTEARIAWAGMSVDEIISLYSQRVGTP